MNPQSVKPLSQQPLSITFTEQQWIVIGAILSDALKKPPQLATPPELFLIAEKIQQIMNRRWRETGTLDLVLNLTGKEFVSAEDLYG
jgi:hypothetical protein